MSGYYNYPLFDKRCISCPFLSYVMVDADENAPYCNKYRKYADSAIEECKKED